MFSLSFFTLCFPAAAGVVVTVVNPNSLSDRPFVGVGKSVGRVWAKLFLFCPCAVHRLVHAHKRLRTLSKLGFSIVSIMLSFEVFVFPECNHQILRGSEL